MNKPRLPLASGEWSTELGSAIVLFCAGMSLIIGSMTGSAPLMATLIVRRALPRAAASRRRPG